MRPMRATARRFFTKPLIHVSRPMAPLGPSTSFLAISTLSGHYRARDGTLGGDDCLVPSPVSSETPQQREALSDASYSGWSFVAYRGHEGRRRIRVRGPGPRDRKGTCRPICRGGV